MRTARTVLKFAPCIFTATSPFKKGKYHKRKVKSPVLTNPLGSITSFKLSQ